MMVKTETRMFILSCAFATTKPKAILGLFSTLNKAYSGLLSETNFKTFFDDISNTLSTFFRCHVLDRS